MVTVKQLIKELKTMPQNLQVGVSMHDNSENEIAGWITSVREITEEKRDYFTNELEEGEHCVVLHC